MKADSAGPIQFQWPRLAHENFHRANNLAIRRVTHTKIHEAVRTAQSKHPGCTICVLTDTEWQESGPGIKCLRDAEAIDPAADRIFVCAFEEDHQLLAAWETIRRIPGSCFYVPKVGFPPARYWHRNRLAYEAIRERVTTFGYLGHVDVAYFETLLQAVELTKDLEGSYVELGVYRGGSAKLVLDYMERARITKFCRFFDTFDGFNYAEAENSRDRTWFGTHQEAVQRETEALLAAYPNQRIEKRNLVTEDFPEDLGPVSLCNVDVDLYDATRIVLEKAAPRIVPNGIMISQDCGYTPWLSGSYLATHEFLQSRGGHDFMPIYMASGQMLLVRKAGGSPARPVPRW